MLYAKVPNHHSDNNHYTTTTEEKGRGRIIRGLGFLKGDYPCSDCDGRSRKPTFLSSLSTSLLSSYLLFLFVHSVLRSYFSTFWSTFTPPPLHPYLTHWSERALPPTSALSSSEHQIQRSPIRVQNSGYRGFGNLHSYLISFHPPFDPLILVIRWHCMRVVLRSFSVCVLTEND